MAESTITIPDTYRTKEALKAPRSPQPSTPLPTPPKKPKMIVEKTLGSAANLIKLLPSGTVLAFQTLVPSFANKGECYTSNKALVGVLIFICSLTCLFFSITDTLKGKDGKVYYGMATFKGMYVFNYDGSDDDDDGGRGRVFDDLSKFRLRMLDYVHAFFTMLIFQSLAFSDTDVQSCLFPGVGGNLNELLKNLPLGAAVLSSLVFMTFPTERKGIGYSDSKPHSL